MADVRLTAINPDDSEVYPVACNDKGELILNGASRLEVSGFLDVASTTYADNTGLYLGNSPGNINFREIRLEKDGSAQFSKNVQVGGFTSYVRTNAATQNIGRFASDVGGLNVDQITFKAGGSAEFAGEVSFPAGMVGVAYENVYLASGNSPLITVQAKATDVNLAAAAFELRHWNSTLTAVDVKARINHDGSASFAGGVDMQSFKTTSATNNYFVCNGDGFYYFNTAGANTGFILAEGSATFTGNVTAPNITFKLAPATVAAMPAPLIDEGFAVNEELDLLSELIKMKLQIRDLNAFMQRTMQDGTETTQ